MNDVTKKDLYRYGGLTGISGLLKGLKKPGFRYTYLLRKMETAGRYSPAYIFYSLFKRHYSYKYGFQIPAGTLIGAGFFLGHFGNVVINGDATIGRNCNIAHGVTIGQSNRGARKGVPSIGNNVWIGANAVIVGKITIGNNVLIAPLTYVNTDIPENSIVIGNPCKIIGKENATGGYINFVPE